MASIKEIYISHTSCGEDDDSAVLPRKRRKLSSISDDRTDVERMADVSSACTEFENQDSELLSIDQTVEVSENFPLAEQNENLNLEIVQNFNSLETDNLSAKESDDIKVKDNEDLNAEGSQSLAAKENDEIGAESDEVLHLREKQDFDERKIEKPPKAEVWKSYESFWPNEMVCVMLWKNTVQIRPTALSSDEMKETFERQSPTIGEETVPNIPVQSSDEMEGTFEGQSSTIGEEAAPNLPVQPSDVMEEKFERKSSTIGEEAVPNIPPQSIDVMEEAYEIKSPTIGEEPVPNIGLPAPSNDVVEKTVERKFSLIGVQLLNSHDNGSCHLFVDQAFRSNEVTWELRAFERHTQSRRQRWSNYSTFESLTNRRGKAAVVQMKYSELFSEPANDYRGNETENWPDKAEKVEIEIYRRTYNEATIEWSVGDSMTCPAVDKWLVVIRNEGREPYNRSDRGHEPFEVMILFNSNSACRVDNYNIIWLEYQAGYVYTVRVIGLKKEKESEGTVCYSVVAFGEDSFRAEYTGRDMKTLLIKARQIEERLQDTNDDDMPCLWLYRDKSSSYFDGLKADHNNLMKIYEKDANGDPASPIHGRLEGLFFSANVNFRTGQPMRPKFGDVRVRIPPQKLLTEGMNIYFGDFYCINTAHLVTLVVTRSNSEADKFCVRNELPLLSRTNWRGFNPFLYSNYSGTEWYVSSRITVEVFFTEDIDLKELSSRYNGEIQRFPDQIIRRQGPKWKNESCEKCNLYTDANSDALVV